MSSFPGSAKGEYNFMVSTIELILFPVVNVLCKFWIFVFKD
jgi:hypothetical protein